MPKKSKALRELEAMEMVERENLADADNVCREAALAHKVVATRLATIQTVKDRLARAAPVKKKPTVRKSNPILEEFTASVSKA